MRYYKSLALRKLRLRRIKSLQPYLTRLGWLSPQRPVSSRGKKHSLWQRTMRCSKHSSTVNVKMLPSFVKRVFGLSPQQNERVHNASSTSVDVVRSLFRLRITALQRGVGRRAKARPSICKTSSEVRSYAKRLWLPKVASLSSVTSRKLSREYLRGFRITQRCLKSSGQEVTLTQRSVLKCLTYPDLIRNRTLIYGSLQRARSWVADMAWVGRHSPRNYSRASLVLRLSGTTWRSQRNSALLKRRSNAS